MQSFQLRVLGSDQQADREPDAFLFELESSGASGSIDRDSSGFPHFILEDL